MVYNIHVVGNIFAEREKVNDSDSISCMLEPFLRKEKNYLGTITFLISFKGLSNLGNSMATICTKINFSIKSKFPTFTTLSKSHDIFKTN